MVKSKSGEFAAQNLMFYRRKDDAYCKIELYQPCATGTLNEQLRTTTVKWLDELDSGKRYASFIGNLRMIEKDGALVSDGKFISNKDAK